MYLQYVVKKQDTSLPSLEIADDFQCFIQDLDGPVDGIIHFTVGADSPRSSHGRESMTAACSDGSNEWRVSSFGY